MSKEVSANKIIAVAKMVRYVLTCRIKNKWNYSKGKRDSDEEAVKCSW